MPGPLTRRPRRAVRRSAAGTVAGAAAGALVVVVGLGGCSAGGDAGSAAPPPPATNQASAASEDPRTAAARPVDPPPPRADLVAVTTLLRTRAAALVSADEQAYAAAVADPRSVPGLAQLAALRAARALRVSRLVVGDVTVAPPAPLAATASSPAGQGTPGPPTRGTRGTLRVRAPLAYRLAGLDRGDRSTAVLVDVTRGPSGWVVVSETADAAGAPPWLAMPNLRVRRGAHAVVAGTVPDSRLAEHVRTVDRAVPALRGAWAGTPQHVLVLAPATAREADALLGRAPGSGQAAVGATTEGPTGADGRSTGDRVVLDPAADARLTAAGRDVVLTHELAHVAVRASVAGRAAGWLSEGYADHVGYTRAGVPATRLLAPLLAQVRAGAGPRGLPRLADLDPRSGAIEVPYLAAWQAVQLLADEHGEAALRRLVAQGSARGSEADAEAATDAALERVLGTTRAQLTRVWQQRLRDLAR